MKISLILILLLSLINPIEDSELIKVRNLYEQAAVKEQAQLKLNNILLNVKEDNYLLTGYKGANIMIGANYVFNPISKLSKFNKGKKLIEQVIAKEPKNLEIRYIRYTIQTNLPKFLGYTSSVNLDKEFLISQLGVMADVDLRDRIVAYLLSSKTCNDKELKKVMEWKKR